MLLPELLLLVHLLGFGTLLTVSLAGIILNVQYRKAPDLQSKLVILRALRPIGLLSPIGMALMLLTGIGNMHVMGIGILSLGWVTAKIFFFAIAAISGIQFGITSRKRVQMVQMMTKGDAPEAAETILRGYDKQLTLFYIVMPVLLLIIVGLSVYGKFEG